MFVSGTAQDSRDGGSPCEGSVRPDPKLGSDGTGREEPVAAPLTDELLIAVMAAHRAWALRYAPHLLEEYNNE